MKKTAWRSYRFLNKKYDETFSDWLYQEFTKDKKTISYGSVGTFWLLSKSETEAMDIMRKFEKEQRK